ncbi:MAG TPA: hypothetical protein VGO93_07745 [Candidatus Xenobia bacterium]|jgi:sugar lactone lactonase YvrE
MKKTPWFGGAAAAALIALGVAGCGTSSSNNNFAPEFAPFATVAPIVNLGLWVANGTNVVEFTPTQTTTVGVSDPIPTVSINSPSFTAPQGVQFDNAGDLWVVDGGDSTHVPAIFEFTGTQLSNLHSVNNPVPAVTLTSPSFVFPQQAVFHGSSLWVTDNGANAVFTFAANQLSAGGSQTPAITMTSTTAFSGPLGLAFDPLSGNLWVANNASNTIYGFTAASLPTTDGSFTVTPNVILSSTSGSIEAPWGLVFDLSGNLFSSNANSPDTVVEFGHSSLAATGTPAPILTLQPTTDGTFDTLNSPNGIALDNLGDLAAVSSQSPFGVAVYGAGQLASGGPIVPDFLLVGTNTTLNAPAGNTFGPVVP